MGTAFLTMPLWLPPYYVLEVSYALVLSIACLAINLLLGTTGLLSLGHAAYFGLGAYAGGFLFTLFDLGGLEVYLLAGVLASGVLAVPVGLICVGATRIHFTILALAFAQLIHAVFVSGLVFRLAGGVGRGLFLLGGGGLYLPRFTILGVEPTPDQFIPAMYYVILISFTGCLAALWRIERSPFGLALRAIRDNEVRAAFVGVRVRRLRWAAFVISALFTGFAGGLYGELTRQVTPEQLHWLFSARLVLATVLGGTRQFMGPVAGAAAYVVLQHVALRFMLYHGLALGVLLIAVVFTIPDGLVPTLTKLSGAGRRFRIHRQV